MPDPAWRDEDGVVSGVSHYPSRTNEVVEEVSWWRIAGGTAVEEGGRQILC
jgi:hypothetical protein